MNNIKKFEDFLDRMQGLLDNAKKQGHIIVRVEDLESTFPELKESEDERIRKVLLNDFKNNCSEYYCEGVNRDMIIAWLEKQGEQKPNPCENCGIATNNCQKYPCTIRDGEQKPADKVEPKFKVGDTIVEKDLDECGCGTIVNIKDGKYIFDDGLFISIKEQELWQLVEQKPAVIIPKFKVGDWVVLSTSDGEKVVRIDSIEYFKSGEPRYITSEGRWFGNGTTAHIWTIQDAKDGDVLSYRDSQWIFIYKGIVTEDTFKYYALLSEKGITVNDAAFSLLTSCITPATKEQRDTLFAKMEEFGYEWDAEKKELKKIEQKFVEWSEEDENRFNNLIFLVECSDENEPTKKGFIDFINRLKSIIHQKQ